MDIFLIDKRVSSDITEEEYNSKNSKFQEFCGTLFYVLYDRFLHTQSESKEHTHRTCVLMLSSKGCETQQYPTSHLVQLHKLRDEIASQSLDPYECPESIDKVMTRVKEQKESTLDHTQLTRLFYFSNSSFGSMQEQASIEEVWQQGIAVHVQYLSDTQPHAWKNTSSQLQVSLLNDTHDFDHFLATQCQPYFYRDHAPTTLRQFFELHGEKKFKLDRVEYLDLFISPHTSKPITKEARQCTCHNSVVSSLGRTRQVYCSYSGKKQTHDDIVDGLQVGRFTVSTATSPVKKQKHDILTHTWYRGIELQGSSTSLPILLSQKYNMPTNVHLGYVSGVVPLNTVIYPYLDHICRVLPLSAQPQSVVSAFPQQYDEQEYTRQDAQWSSILLSLQKRQVGQLVESFVEDMHEKQESTAYNARKRWLLIHTHSFLVLYGVTPGVDLQKHPQMAEQNHLDMQKEQVLSDKMDLSSDMVDSYFDSLHIHSGETQVDYVDGFTDELSVAQLKVGDRTNIINHNINNSNVNHNTSTDFLESSTLKRKSMMQPILAYDDENIQHNDILTDSKNYRPPTLVPLQPSNTLPPVTARPSSLYKRVRKK